MELHQVELWPSPMEAAQPGLQRGLVPFQAGAWQIPPSKPRQEGILGDFRAGVLGI